MTEITASAVMPFVQWFWREGLAPTLPGGSGYAPGLSLNHAAGLMDGSKMERERAIMAYVITDTCTKDELCVEACPTDCIHPKKDEEGFEAATQLYVDPDGCIDCGACVPVCPTNSIFVVDEVPADKQEFIAKNAEHYATA